eukprot:scaffold129997_cov60-Phaeocystis_antarctica.AAC.2
MRTRPKPAALSSSSTVTRSEPRSTGSRLTSVSGSLSRLPSLMPTSSASAAICCSWFGLGIGCAAPTGICAECTMVRVSGLKKETRPESVAMTM